MHLEFTFALGAESLTVLLIFGWDIFIAANICNLPVFALSRASINMLAGTPSLRRQRN